MKLIEQIAIIIPYRNDETELAHLQSALHTLTPEAEVHCIKGDSRAEQMNRGALRTRKKFLWFLHADSVVDEDCISALCRSLESFPNALHYFELGFVKGSSPLMKINSVGANFRSHFFHMPFGDQGFCISKENFVAIGGFDEGASYGEDHLFVWKARFKGIPIVCTGARLRTSARKYERNGWLRTTLKHLCLTYKQAIPESVKLFRAAPKRQGAVAVFVKTPGLSPVKTRLAASIGKEKADAVYLRLVREVECLAKDLSGTLQLKSYWAVAEREGCKDPLWKGFSTISQGDGELGDRLSKVYNELIEKHDFVFLIGADCPALSLAIVQEATELLKSSRCVIGRTIDGGFYLFGGRSPIKKAVWKRVPYSTKDTADSLIHELKDFHPIAELQQLRDVDTVEDLAALGWQVNN